MDGLKKLHDEQDEFIKKTLQEDKIVTQSLFDNISVQMNKTNIKVKKYTYRQQHIITLLLILLIISVGFNIYLGVVKETSIINIFQPAQDYSSTPDNISKTEDSKESENIVENTVDNTVNNTIDNSVNNEITNSIDNTIQNNIKIDAVIIETTVTEEKINTTVENVVSNEKTTSIEEPKKETPAKNYKEINTEEIKSFVNQFAIGINKLNLNDTSNLESNTVLLYITQKYFSQQSHTSSSLSVNTDYASSATNFHKFLNEFTDNDYSKMEYLKSYNNYIGYISRSKSYVYGNDYSILAKEKYNCENVVITNKENNIYTAVANVSRTYGEEKTSYEVTFTFKINDNYKYQKYKLLSLNSKLTAGDVETIVHLIGN